jgi:hypothetical protein
VNIFPDTSVLLAACQSDIGASRCIVDRGSELGYSTAYVIEETERNLPELRPEAPAIWNRIRRRLVVMEDIWALDHPVVFEISKDRPVLFSAFAYSEILLTLDQKDFADILGSQFYGLEIRRPGEFLHQQRALGVL